MNDLMMIGNAHIDPVWLWQWQEGFHEVKATFRSALDRMNEDPDFIFTCACAQYYEWVEENAPDMFEEIRQRVKEGRWQIAGGMWIQPDMNTPSGESQVRQLLYSQLYFKDKFGRIATVGHNVDSFGHNAMMPQIYRKAGISSYVWMRPGIHENPNIPEGPMIWEAPDGSRVTAYRIFGEYTGAHELPDKIQRVMEFSRRIGQPAMCFYGVGNHGGGPTIENLKQINAYRREAAASGKPSVRYASTEDYFASLDPSGLPLWNKELQHHASGCYSTHSLSKKKHREAENALLRMEAFTTLAEKLTGHLSRKPFIDQAWKDLLFNEFHDIMGGCCLSASLEDAVMQLNEAKAIAAREENTALQTIAWNVDTSKGDPLVVRSKEEDWKFWGAHGQGTPILVFNPHAFDAECDVLLRRPLKAVRDDQGHPVPAQLVRAGRTNGKNDRYDGLFRARVPALGYRLYWAFLEDQEDAFPVSLQASAPKNGNGPAVLENDQIRAEFDQATGALTHLILRSTGQDALISPVKLRCMDIEHCDTWAHNIFRFDKETPVTVKNVQMDVLENGPVRSVLRIRFHFNESFMEQRYILYEGSDQLEMEVTLDMHEKFRMLKLCFPTPYQRSLSEIPYGVIEREANGEEQPCQRFVVMVQAGSGPTCAFVRGLAVLNNGKYSYSADDGELRMTISNTSLFADHYGQDYRDDTCEFMDQGIQHFSLTLVPFAGDLSSAGLCRRASLLNRPMPHIEETYHTGPLPGEYRGITVSDPTVDVTVIKKAEKEAAHVLRMVETTGMARSLDIDLALTGQHLSLALSPFEIKTVLIRSDGWQEVNELEEV